MKTLDLHGLTTEEVIPLIDQLLLHLQQSGAEQARIITGKGSGKVQKVTVAYLEKAGYRWHYERLDNGKPNHGVLIVNND